MDEFEKSIIEKIDRFKNAVQMATSNSPKNVRCFSHAQYAEVMLLLI